MKSKEFGIIGLGKFGRQLGTVLTGLGHKVIGVDSDERRTRLVQDDITQVYVADATDRTALEELRFQDLDTVAVSVGDSLEASILITLNLQEMGISHIIAKANSLAHRKVLERLGAGSIIQPESDVAALTAYRLHSPGLLDFLPVSGGVLVQEVIVDAWSGKSLRDMDTRQTSGVLVAAAKKRHTEEFRFVPDPSEILEKGDVLLLLGTPEAVLRLKT